ncbi:hypothetical protein [Nonomuraea sp. B19D2]
MTLARGAGGELRQRFAHLAEHPIEAAAGRRSAAGAHVPFTACST